MAEIGTWIEIPGFVPNGDFLPKFAVAHATPLLPTAPPSLDDYRDALEIDLDLLRHALSSCLRCPNASDH